MEQRSRLQKNIPIFMGMLFVMLLIVDRYYWAQIAQWREDQATNIWLGYTAGVRDMSVGLISSRYIPNPNGMVLLGSFLSLLPNLLSISFFLGFAQIALLLVVGWKSFGNRWRYFLLVAIPPLTSVVLRSTSVEYWNQYTITLVNVAFVYLALGYLEKPSLWNLPLVAALILLAPSLYLAGVVNAIVMTIITLGMMIYKNPPMKNLWLVAIITSLIVLLSAFTTWLPYFHGVGWGQIAEINKRNLGSVALFKSLWDSIFGIPMYVTFQWADKSIFPLAFKHADERILSYMTQLLLKLVARAYLLQAVFAFGTFAYMTIRTLLKGLFKSDFRPAINTRVLRVVTVSTLFSGLSFAVSTWLGGPDWIHGERPDQIVQFLPIFLFLIFLLPFVIINKGIAQVVIRAISVLSLTIFGAANLLCGFMIIRDHLQYRGNILTEADVPLTDKMQAIDFIAKDWRQHSSSDVIPVDYDLEGGTWNTVSATKPAMLLTRWYPAPLTEGREFDYEFLRRYGLTNSQEGMQLRHFGNGRYLITYTFDNPPQINSAKTTNYIFGRLRVTIVEK